MPRNHRRLRLALYVVLLAACAPSTVKPAATTTPGSATRAVTAATPITAATPPTPTAIPPTGIVPPTSVQLPGEQDLAQLKDQVLQQLIGDQTAAPDQPLDVSVLPLTISGELSPLYAAYSTGSILSLLPDGRHVLAFYTFADGRWDKLQQVSLNSSDYVHAASVQQVSIGRTISGWKCRAAQARTAVATISSRSIRSAARCPNRSLRAIRRPALATPPTSTATVNLEAKPDLAAAHFSRGWATYLRDGGSAWAINDIERAAQIDPDEALYAQSVVYLKH